MFASEIEDLIHRSRVMSRHFAAVVDASGARLIRSGRKNRTDSNVFWICNVSDFPGSHWFYVFLTKDRIFQIMDPLGV